MTLSALHMTVVGWAEFAALGSDKSKCARNALKLSDALFKTTTKENANTTISSAKLLPSMSIKGKTHFIEKMSNKSNDNYMRILDLLLKVLFLISIKLLYDYVI